MTQLITMFAGQFLGYALAILYPLAALGSVVAWSWLTLLLLLTLFGLAGTVGGFVVARRRGPQPERGAASRAVRGLLGAFIGVIIVGNLVVSIAVVLAVASGTGVGGVERLWEGGLVWLTLAGLPGGYILGRR